MKFKNKASALITRVFAFLLLFSGANVDVAFAQNSGNTAAIGSGNTASGTNDSNPGTAWDIRKNYFLRFPVAQEFGPYESGGTDVIKDKVSQGTATGGTPMVVHSLPGCPVYVWPIYVPFAASTVPTYRDMAIDEELFQTFGFPVSDTQFQIIQRYNDNRMLEEMFDPERIMWLTSTIAGMQSTSAANGAANMTTNQSQSAIDFTKEYLTNFTAEAGNRWQTIRDQLFIPIAVLLLLPGAVLAQVKAIVSQSSPVLGETNPFEGIIRSIVAIFLIPGTFLVINYGIDVSNSITFTIADEYTRIFGTDMYVDAQCAEARAFPINAPQSNSNAMRGDETPATSNDTSGWGPYEALNLGLRKYDPCAHIDVSNSPDEEVRDAKKIARLLTNGTNCTLTLMWNTLCAFQMAFLYYLWCMGPIAAALWVWPLQKLRGALPSWIEGVITLCFWSLFWNTCVLLLACFRGVGETGTVIVTALHYLATICVKYAFDFSGLVSQGGSGGVAQSLGKAMQHAGGAMGGAQRGGAAAGHGAAAGAAHGGTAAGAHPGLATAGAAAGRPGASTSNSTLAHAGSATGSGLSLGAAQGNTVGGLGIGGTTGAAGSASGAGAALQPPSAATGPNAQAGVISPDTGMPPHSGAADNAILPSGSGALSGLPNTGQNGISANQFMASSNTAAGAMAFTQNHNSTASMPIHDGSGAMCHTPSTNVGPDGKVQLDTAQMGNLNGNPMDPNSQAHQQLAQQLQALNSGDPNALHAVSANAGQPMDANAKAAYDNFSTHGQQMSAADQAAVNSFAEGKGGITMGADGTLINTATGEPIHVGQGGLPPEGLHLGGQNTGVPMEANQISSSPLGANGSPELNNPMGTGVGAHEVQGTNGAPGPNDQSVDLGRLAQEHPGQNLGALSASEIGSAQSGQGLMGLAAAEGVSNPQLSVHNGQMELTGANGQQLASYNAQSQQWEANGTNGSVVMGANGQWESATTHQSMAFENGQWAQAAGASGAGAIASNDLHTLASMNLATPTQDYSGATATNTGAGAIASNDLHTLASMNPGASAAQDYAGTSAGAMGSSSGMSADAPLSQAAQHSLSSLAQSEGLGSSVSYNATSSGYVAQSENGTVIANYDSASHHWTSPQGGGATMDSNGQWVNQSHNAVSFDNTTHQWSSGTGVEQQLGSMSNSPSPINENVQQSLNNLAQSEGARSVSYEATSTGYTAQTDNGTVIANYDNATHQWSSPQGGGAVMDGASGQWSAGAAGNSSSVTYDNASHQWTQASVTNAADSTVAHAPLSQNVQQGLESLAQSTTGSAQVSIESNANGMYAQSGGQTIAQYDSSSQTWMATPGGTTNSGVSFDQGSGQWVAQGTSTPVSYDSTNHNWSVTGSNESIAYQNNQFSSQGYSAPANAVSESSISQAMHGHPEALAQQSVSYGDVNNFGSGSGQSNVVATGAPEPGFQPTMTTGSAPAHDLGSAPAPAPVSVDLGNYNWGAGQTVQAAGDSWTSNTVASTPDLSAPQSGTYFDPTPIAYQDQGQLSSPTPIAYQDQGQVSYPTADSSLNATNYAQQNYEQYPTGSASIAPDPSSFTLPAPQSLDGGFPVHHHVEAPQTGSFEPSYAAVPPESSGQAFSGGQETQMHVAPPDHTAEIVSTGIAGAAMLAASNASHSAPAPAPEAHAAPPNSSGSPLQNLLHRATGQKQPAAPPPPQQPSHEASAPGHQEAKVSEGGLAGAILNRGKKKQKDAHQQALNDAGHMPGQEDA
ncbi:MAG: hypothetical protein P4L53_11840 [Candidatus Obscuribacterales bacterium]|nr:hypothetical protein [Candidatus Obscuribacterales bacterium]